MECTIPKTGAEKRRGSPIDDTRPIPHPPTSNGMRVEVGARSANTTPINYLMKARNEKLRLIEGDWGIFADILKKIDDYEGLNSKFSFKWHSQPILYMPYGLVSDLYRRPSPS